MSVAARQAERASGGFCEKAAHATVCSAPADENEAVAVEHGGADARAVGEGFVTGHGACGERRRRGHKGQIAAAVKPSSVAVQKSARRESEMRTSEPKPH